MWNDPLSLMNPQTITSVLLGGAVMLLGVLQLGVLGLYFGFPANSNMAPQHSHCYDCFQPKKVL